MKIKFSVENKIWVQKYLSGKNVGSKKVLDKKYFWIKIWVQSNIVYQKNFIL